MSCVRAPVLPSIFGMVGWNVKMFEPPMVGAPDPEPCDCAMADIVCVDPVALELPLVVVLPFEEVLPDEVFEEVVVCDDADEDAVAVVVVELAANTSNGEITMLEVMIRTTTRDTSNPDPLRLKSCILSHLLSTR